MTYDAQDGALDSKVPPEQREAYQADLQECQAAFERENPPKPLNDADFRALYKQEIEAMECLERVGFPPVSKPISEQQYVAEYASGKPPSWYAYQALGGNPSPEIIANVEKACPQPNLDE